MKREILILQCNNLLSTEKINDMHETMLNQLKSGLMVIPKDITPKVLSVDDSTIMINSKGEIYS